MAWVKMPKADARGAQLSMELDTRQLMERHQRSSMSLNELQGVSKRLCR